MDEKCPNTGDVGGCGGSEQCVLDERLAQASSLPGQVDRETGKEHHRDWMPGQPLADPERCGGVFDCSGRQAVVGEHRQSSAGDIGPGAIGVLVRERETLQKTIEWLFPALEGIDIVRCVELLDWRQPLLSPASLQHALLRKQSSQAGLVGDRAVEDSLEGLPLAIVEAENPPVDHCHTDSVTDKNASTGTPQASHPPDGPRHGADGVGPHRQGRHRARRLGWRRSAATEAARRRAMSRRS